MLSFTAVILSAGLSGLEPFVLLPTEYKRLESARMYLLRRVFGQKGWGATKKSRAHRGVTDETKASGSTYLSFTHEATTTKVVS